MSPIRSTTPPQPERKPEVIIALPPLGTLVPVTAIRGTLVVTSLKMLRDMGAYDGYVAHLGKHRDAILSAVAGEWLPVEMVAEHYRACDASGFDPARREQVTGDAASHAHGLFLTTMINLARASGIDPWIGLRRFDKIMARTHKGGAVGITQLRSKEVMVEFIGQPLAGIRYYREDFRLMLKKGAELFSARAEVRAVEERCTPTAVCFHGTWL